MQTIHNAYNYQIDEMGRVYSNKYKRFLNGNIGKKGYLTFVLRFNDGSVKRVYSHRLVADNFIQKVHGKNFVNHIDGNTLNNSVENLEWCTNAENLKHARDVLGRKLAFCTGIGHHNAKLDEEKVNFIRNSYSAGFQSQSALAKKFNVSRLVIHCVVHRKTWKHVQ